jgi:alcohol dehydrogenase class IV
MDVAKISEEKARQAPLSLIAHREKVGFPKGITETTNIREEDIQTMAGAIIDHPVKFRNPRQLTFDDCLEIYRRVL